MIVYEVNLAVDAAVIEDFRAWLNGHIAEVLALPGFLGAELFDVDDPPAAPDTCALCVQYRLTDAAALQSYFAEHAPRLREDGLTRFPGRFSAQRRVLRPAGG